MKTNGTEKNFDAVKTMREIRDQMSREIMNMTFAEEKAYLKKLIGKKEKAPRQRPATTSVECSMTTRRDKSAEDVTK